MTKAFKTGRTYSGRSICDHNCIVSIKIAKRTAKTIVTDEGKRFRISVYDGAEFVRPWGNFSMALMIYAD